MSRRDVHARTARVAPWNREDAGLDAHVQRRLLSGRRTVIVLSDGAPAEYRLAHVHSVDQVTIVLRGRVEFRVDDVLHRLGPGQSVHIPAGSRHAMRSADPSPAETLHLFLPAS